MWIFFGILLGILLLVAFVLLLPVSFIIKPDQNEEFTILYKVLFITFGKNPKPNQPIVKALKDISGINRLEKNKKTETKAGEALSVLRENFSLIISLLKRLLTLLKKCTVKKLKIDIVSAGEDAADAAVHYGAYYAVISPLLSFIHSNMKIKKRGEKINIYADFQTQNSSFKYEIILAVRIFRILAALFGLALEESRRTAKADASRTTNKNPKPNSKP